jgi:VWFA-related protein
MEKSMLKIAGIILVLTSTPVFPFSFPTQKQDEKPVRIGINLVTLDVAVTDKHRRPVRGLTEKDFIVSEDGVTQRIESLTAGEQAPLEPKTRPSERAVSSSSAGTGTAPNPLHGTRFQGYRFTTLVVDNGSIEPANRDPIERAMTRYIREHVGKDDLVAVFSAGPSLGLVQPFTNDRDKLLAAAGRAAKGHAGTEAASDRREGEREAQQAARTEGTGSVTEQADRASRDVLATFNAVTDYFQARSLFSELLAIVTVQRNLTGPKSLILFSQGTAIPVSGGYAIDGIISAATASGVSIYVIDAGGLTVGEAPKGFDPRGNVGLPGRNRPDVYGGEDPTKVVGGENGIERALKRTLNDSQPNRFGAISRLASETGGLAMTNTNDLVGAVDSVDSDARAHYMISYAPKNQQFDGRYREISVKVSDPQLTVRTRHGYYAVKSEAAVGEDDTVRRLAADLRNGIESQLALDMAVAYFPRGPDSYLVPVLVRLPGNTISTAKHGDRYQADLDLVITVKDSGGAVVSTFGRGYSIELTDEESKRLPESSIPIKQNVRLTPGTYIISAAVRDRMSGHTGVLRRGVTLPAMGDGPLLSSLTLAHQVTQILPAAQSQLTRDVFAYGQDMVLMPTDSRFNLTQTLLLFFRVYPPRSSGANTSLLVAAAFLKEGKVVQRTPTARMTQQAASPDSGIAVLTPLKLADMEPGEYTVRVQVLDEATRLQDNKEAHFSLGSKQ